jgi:hypothetical protein
MQCEVRADYVAKTCKSRRGFDAVKREAATERDFFRQRWQSTNFDFNPIEVISLHIKIWAAFLRVLHDPVDPISFL